MSASGQTPLKVLVVDDEPLARENVRVLLAADPQVEVVGECTGLDAPPAIARLRPDILFLDIQMPDLDGFALLDLVGPAAVPAVVFVTAFDQYALHAFEVHALDYLLKPFTDARFKAALARAKSQAHSHRQGGLDASISALLQARQAPRSRFLIPGRDKNIVLEADQIDWIGAADYYVSLHCGGVSHLLRESMEEMERQLDPEQFVRVHRGTIVNLARVREVHPLFRGGCELKLTDGTMLKLSRDRRARFEARFALLGMRR
ncbi:LytR/AlgR family response regulator transcription factor [Montanilutibacter psychrotolerans]|uniref:DNA-binding response regulator n=1 Tax=Montanilutibacter psychrotolerans TaxID=1327343 RepID=A0A3M8T3L1_9GAMM|nr:LytTR family DNA-binding domain-containing protein [Lysobacter psychrotolerans]RNF86256.1 DNA-binding response regulator [Lysobacter psychrotolerans]